MSNRLHVRYDGVFDICKDEVAKTANYTITYADNGNLFTNTGAAGPVTFTLPPISGQQRFFFLCVADQNMTIASPEGNNLVTFNDATATSVAFSTAGQKIGGHLELFTNLAGTRWYVKQYSANALTVT